MKTWNEQAVLRACIDVSCYRTCLRGGQLRLADSYLIVQLARALKHQPGFVICCGIGDVLREHDMTPDSPTAIEIGRDYLAALFREVAEHLSPERPGTPAIRYGVVCYDADGHAINTSTAPNGTPYVTTKALHFDAAAPFVANIYGPYRNIVGGWPVIADVRAYCAAGRLDPATIVENVPNSYNVALRTPHAEMVAEHYAFALDAALDDAMVMVMLRNELADGLAHGATPSALLDPALPGSRPIRHLEFRPLDLGDLARWYAFYGLDHVVPGAHNPGHVTSFTSGASTAAIRGVKVPVSPLGDTPSS